VNELTVKVNQTPGKIDFNFDEIKGNVEQLASAYEGVEVTEETTKNAKTDIATLRKIQKAIEDKRKEVKEECLKPYNDFEKKSKELVAIIEKPIISIDIQVKQYEIARKQKKKEDIKTTYDGLIGDMVEYLPFEKIYDAKWENTNVSMKSIKEAITELVENTCKDVQTIKGMSSECEADVLKKYKQDLSLTNAISAISRYEQQKKEILERAEARRKKEEEQKAKEAAAAAECAQSKPEPEQPKKPEQQKEPEHPKFTSSSGFCNSYGGFVNQTEHRAIYTVTGDKEDFIQVDAILNSMGLRFERTDA
jgi:Txe/YoeB family toxin of Txe-Axe toxin-antitoxin module